jgi:hypothetical protein
LFAHYCASYIGFLAGRIFIWQPMIFMKKQSSQRYRE